MEDEEGNAEGQPPVRDNEKFYDRATLWLLVLILVGIVGYASAICIYNAPCFLCGL